MRNGIFTICFLLLACGTAPPGARRASVPEVEGARLFKAKGCVNCHTLGNGIKVGPDLQGLFLRREEAWVRRYISDPVVMAEQDPIARGLKEKFKVQMPRMLISPAELDGLIAYLRLASSPIKP